MLDVVSREREPSTIEPESDDMRLREHPAILEGRSDKLFADPRKLKVEEGYNIRDLTTPKAREKLDELKPLVKEHGVRDPLVVRFDGTDIWIVEGHRRLIVALELIAEHKASGGAEGKKIEYVPIISEPNGTTPLDRDFGLRHSNSGEQLEPLEFANLIYRTMNQRGISEQEAAKGFGVTIGVLRNHLKMRAILPDEVKEQVRAGDVSATTAVKEVKRSRGEAAANIRKAKEAQKAKGKKTKAKATPKSIRAVTQPKAEPQQPAPQPEAETVSTSEPRPPVQGGYTAPVGDGIKPPLPTIGSGVMPARESAAHPDQHVTDEAAPYSETVSLLIALTREGTSILAHNKSEDNPGYWTREFEDAIQDARDHIEQITGKKMEFETLPDATAQVAEEV